MKLSDNPEIVLLGMDTAVVLRGDDEGNILQVECYLPDGEDDDLCPNTVFAISLVATMMSDEAESIREQLVQMMELKTKTPGRMN